VHGDDDLAALRMAPFLVAATLGEEDETVTTKNADNIVGGAEGEVRAHGRATSSSLASLPNSKSVGSNHKARASFALATASSSVSPAEPQPGRSGNTADQRFVSESSSTTNRSFMRHIIAVSPTRSKLTEGANTIHNAKQLRHETPDIPG